jgi:signal transduction histidine kinase
MNSILKTLIASVCAAALAGTATAQTLPPLISADEFLSGQYDMMPIRAECIIRDAFRDEINPGYIYLVLLWDGEIIYAAFPVDDITDETITSFLGAGIIATGTPIPRLYGQREKLGRNLQILSSNAIVIHRKPATDIFSVPDVTRLEGTDPSELQHLDRHGFSGIVLAVWEKNNVLLLGKGTAGKDELVVARLATDDVPKYGEHIYVSGFPGTDLHHYTLSRAWWTRTREKPAPPEETAESGARTLTTDAEGRPRFRCDMHGRPVRMRGIVRTTVNEEGLFMIENEGLLVPVYASAALEKTSEMEIGCTIEVAGTCIMDIEDWRTNSVFPQIHRFLLVTRTPSDLRIIALPPWWTTERILWVIGALLGGIIAILLWNAALSRSAARKGRELYRVQIERVKADLRTEERTRLAVELHDTLAQNLTGVSMQLAAGHVEIAEKTLKSCRDDLRDCLWDLRSQALEEPDMTQAILKTLRPHTGQSRVTVRFNVPRGKLSDKTAHALLRSIRELAVNALRHGKATDIKVAGALEGEHLICSVSDNGCGFDPVSAPGVLQGHFGLQGIRERIDALGGEFTIESTPDKGTKARMKI